ncbi:MAG: MBL fold metallo-hydrolase [Planctomycetes bacterium]|nr:MBL fold metallo-hydrolase [Planctomycetota bacterium]
MAATGSFEISFLGGASSIGASCTLVRVAGAAFVIDCGVRYSGSSPLPDLSLLADTRVDAVLVTHAHMDHSGALPILAEACPGAPVFATPPTIDLVAILLRDALRLMNAADRESEVPLYNEPQVDRLLKSMAPVKFHQPLQVGEVEIRWLPASHILGAAMILMRTPAGTLLFTGDYSISAQHTVPALGRPDFHADLVISESTYGERLHENRQTAETRLLSQIGEVVDRGGRVLIPAFAVGRAQEVLLILKRALRNGRLPDTPVFVDGMVRAVCDVYRSHDLFVSRGLIHEIRRTPHAFYTDSIQPVMRREDRARVLGTSPCIIVASSGMLSGGPSAGYCQELAKNEKDAILLTGYQDEESPGRALLDLAKCEGPKLLRMGQASVPVACQFGTYGLSAHADRMQMASLIEAVSPRTVMLVHGDQGAKQSLASSLSCDDVICAQDGLTIRRGYPERRGGDRRSAATVPTADDLDIDRARNLLGPPSATPLRASAVAESWFGHAVDRTTVDHFARVLESVGLVRRDDHRRDRLWVLGVHETDLFPDEAELDERLKQANPKGRLLEFCMRMRLDPPLTDIQARGAFFEARSSLCCQGRMLESGPFRAASKKSAEQLAAQALLTMVSQGSDEQTVVHVTDDDAARLQSLNPKGMLLEWCAKSKTPPPRFEQDATPGGYRIRAVLSVSEHEPIVTDWHVAAKLKMAEQAASEQLLQRLPNLSVGAPQQLAAPPATVAAAVAGPADGPNPMAIINELVQAGLVQASGYEFLDQTGPSHQPTFTIVAWARIADGRTVRTQPIGAPSKKSGQRAAADRLLDLLVSEGITRR